MPPTPLLEQGNDWMCRALRSIGVNPDAGEAVPAMFRRAGLPVSGVAVATAASAGPAPAVECTAATLHGLLPQVVGTWARRPETAQA